MYATPEWLKSEALQAIMAALGDGNVYAVGGCVRDALIGREANDVDLATRLTPEEVQKRLEETVPGVVMIPTGLEHGTWTAMIGAHVYEITSYRKDVDTDGRRATVAYAETIEEDAQRRDFTMNALYMTRQGVVCDPTGRGITDIASKTIRFVGDPGQRCVEDYLRILRLFRFAAQFDGWLISPSALDAAIEYAPSLKTRVSGERKWMEIKKILGAAAPCKTLNLMAISGVLGQLFDDFAVARVERLVEAEGSVTYAPRWQRRYAALTDYAEIPFPCAKAEEQYIARLREYRGAWIGKVAFETNRLDVAVDSYILSHAAQREPCSEQVIKSAATYVRMRCPVTATTLMNFGVKQGPELGVILKQARDLYISSHFTASEEGIMNAMFGP